MIPRHVYTREVDWNMITIWGLVAAYLSGALVTVAYLVWRNRPNG
jgi:hypothetical protein